AGHGQRGRNGLPDQVRGADAVCCRPGRAGDGGLLDRHHRPAPAVRPRAGQGLRGVPLGWAAQAARHLRDGVPVRGGGPDRPAGQDALARHQGPERAGQAGYAFPPAVRRRVCRAEPRLPGHRLGPRPGRRAIMLRLLILFVSMLTTRRDGGTAEPGRLPLRDRYQRGGRERDRDSRDRDALEREARDAWEAWEQDEWEDGDPWDGDRWDGETWYVPPDQRRYEPEPHRTRPHRTVPRQVAPRPVTPRQRDPRQ